MMLVADVRCQAGATVGKSAKKYKRRGRKHDATGRSVGDVRFVMLEHYMLASAAWKSLKCPSRALYVALRQRYNGSNNGKISMSAREAASELHIAKDTATICFRDLERKGFIRVAQKGSFNWKQGMATTWILTADAFNGELATKDFMRWLPKENGGPKSGTKCPKSGTASEVSGSGNSVSVPNGAHFCDGEQ